MRKEAGIRTNFRKRAVQENVAQCCYYMKCKKNTSKAVTENMSTRAIESASLVLFRTDIPS
jgi:hypothetical protein